MEESNDLGWLLCPTDSARKLLAYGAFFDDTGTSPKQKIAAFAGYFGPEKEWTALEGPWRDLLADARVPHFRAYDCVRCTGVFGTASVDECHEYYERAVSIITEREIVGIAIAGRRRDFQGQIPPFEGPGSEATDVYEYSIVAGLIHLAGRFLRTWPGEKLSLVCEDGKRADNDRVSRAFYNLREHSASQWAADAFAGPPDFRSKTHHYGLQVADVLAYELGLDLASRTHDTKIDTAHTYRPEFVRLSDHIELRGGTLQIHTTNE